jgi:3-hydroxyacyl-CoA dehydrogenase
MGGGIATLLAGIGIPVVLLDITAKDTQPGDPPARRNALVLDNLGKLKKARIPAIFAADDLNQIAVGNLDDDLSLLRDADWIIEVIVERLDVKQALMARLDDIRKPGAIISSNTSGLSINAIAEGRSDDFRRHFLGTHFFNPPRHLKLLEVIPGQHTDPDLVRYMQQFGDKVLGKGVVICKDTPNFIANRFISMCGTFNTAYAIDHGFTVEEVDLLTGQVVGHPKSGTFRLSDIVGNDISVHVAQNLYPAIPDDADREILKHAGMARVYSFLLQNNFLGDKTGQGFFKKVDKDGQREFRPLDLNTLEYVPPAKVRFDSIGKARKIDDTGSRIKALINESDRAAQYIWHTHAYYLSYASRMVGEIADDIVSIDNANKWGFAHELGAFEIWDAIGVRDTVARMERDGYNVAPWVHTMLAHGCESFYRRDANGVVNGHYDPRSQTYLPLQPDPRTISIRTLRATGKEVDKNAGASLFDLGDGVALLEFHTKANALDDDIFRMMDIAFQRLDADFDALVVGNQGEYFCAGANLFLMAMLIQNQDWTGLTAMQQAGQDMAQRLRFAPKPVVFAPHNLAVGGGCEFTMAAPRVVAHAELYIGLVEIGVGIIPGFSGCKEMLRRVVNPVMRTSNADVLAPMQKVFEQIALAKVSTSAMEARTMGILTEADSIVMNKDHLLADAKRAALDMVAAGYRPQPREKIYAAGRDTKAALFVAIDSLRWGKYATDHEAKIARKLAHILCGGDLSGPAWVDEDYILELEREALLSLAGEPKTLERIQHMLLNNKPLRN